MAKPQKISRQKKSRSPVNANTSILSMLDDNIRFSFKYLDCYHEKFCAPQNDPAYFLKLNDRLKHLSSMTAVEFQTKPSKALRNHSFNFGDCKISEDSFGIPNEEQIVDKPWQFGITANAYGRIHGFFIMNTFYVVWLDPEHKLCP